MAGPSIIQARLDRAEFVEAAFPGHALAEPLKMAVEGTGSILLVNVNPSIVSVPDLDQSTFDGSAATGQDSTRQVGYFADGPRQAVAHVEQIVILLKRHSVGRRIVGSLRDLRRDRQSLCQV